MDCGQFEAILSEICGVCVTKFQAVRRHGPGNFQQQFPIGRRIMLIGRFLKDRRGGIAPILALGIVPLIGAVGTSVDYSRANAARTAMQAAIDAAAVVLLKKTEGLSPDQLNDNGKSYFEANFVRPEVQNVGVTAVLSSISGGSTLTMS